MPSTVVRQIALFRVLAAIEAVVATVCLAAAGWVVMLVLHEASVKRHTHERMDDTGAIAWMVAVTLLAPAGVLLGVASVSLWRRWRIRWWVQGVTAVGMAGLIWSLFFHH